MPDFSQPAAPAAPAPSAPASTPAAKTPSPGPAPSAPKMTSAQFRAKMDAAATSGGPFGNAPDDAAEAPEALSVPDAVAEPADALEEGAVENPLDAPAEDEDTSWLEGLKPFRKVHDMDVQELLAALAEGNLPEALWDKLNVELKNGDETWKTTFGEARNGAMRADSYHRKTTALAQERAKFQQEAQAFTTERDQITHLLQAWKGDATGRSLLNGLRGLGLPVMEMAQALANELDAVDKLGPGAMELYQTKAKLEADLEMERQKLQFWQQHQEREAAQRAQQEATIRNEATTKHVHTKVVPMFKKANLAITDGSWNLFTEHLNPLWDVTGGPEAGPPTDIDIQTAFKRTFDEIEAYQKAHLAEAKPVVAGTPVTNKIPAKALDAPAPKAGPAGRAPNGAKKQLTSAEFRRRLMG